MWSTWHILTLPSIAIPGILGYILGLKYCLFFSVRRFFPVMLANAKPLVPLPLIRSFSSESGLPRLRLRGLPFHATAYDVRGFFRGFRLAQSGAVELLRHGRRPTGQAFAYFQDVVEAMRAKDGRKWRWRKMNQIGETWKIWRDGSLEMVLIDTLHIRVAYIFNLDFVTDAVKFPMSEAVSLMFRCNLIYLFCYKTYETLPRTPWMASHAVWSERKSID